MRKFGIQLLGFLFLIGSIISFISLLTRADFSPGGFLGLSIVIGNLDIMEWIGVYVLGYIGYYLLKLDIRGRRWALIVLWPYTIASGIILVIACISFASPEWVKAFSVELSGHEVCESSPIIRLLFIALIFVIFASALYFLLRKDTKALFQQPEGIE